MEYYSAMKKEWNLPICKNREGAREDYAMQNQSEKDKYHMISLIYETEETKGKRRKKRERQTEKQTLNYREQTDGYQREVGGGMG